MKALYELVGISRQALHQFNADQMKQVIQQERVIEQAKAIRLSHPQMGCRTVYHLMNDVEIGRDKIEALLLTHGFRVRRRPNYLKTTHRQELYKFPNLIKGLEIQSINRIWQTDITYYMLPHEVCYLVFIIDVYSRRIIGHTAHSHMRATANMECLKMAFKTRKDESLKNLIHHSDMGSQYVFKEYLDALRSRGIRISMCDQAWQNAYTERINGTLKNDYLKHRDIKSLNDLRKFLNRDVHTYNHERPHKNLLFKMSPVQFEEHLKTSPKSKHPILKIYNHEEE